MYKSIRKRIFIRLRPNDSKCNETCHALKHIDQHSILKVNMCRMSKLFSFTVKENDETTIGLIKQACPHLLIEHGNQGLDSTGKLLILKI